jgi:hypothetical protein
LELLKLSDGDRYRRVDREVLAFEGDLELLSLKSNAEFFDLEEDLRNLG